MRPGWRMSEMTLLRSILLACSRGPTRLFRQNTGQGWVGQSRRFSRAETVVVQPGDVLIRNARPLHAGLCEGSSDLIGWTQRDGQALFTAIEVKAEHGRLTPEQAAFLRAVEQAGGVAGVARSVDEARVLLDGRGVPFVG
jgi:hypothetical protein